MSSGGSLSQEQVIREFLATGRKRSGAPPHAPEGFDARPASIHFGKMRQVGQRQLHAVTFENHAGQRMRFICCVRSDDAGVWRFDGGAGGHADSSPHRDHPWANLGGGGWPHQFYAGGQVLDDGGVVMRVRLRTANGVTLEDTVGEDGIVLFLNDDETHVPLSVELLDGGGQIVAQHQAMGG